MTEPYYDNSDPAQRFQPGTTVESSSVDYKFDEVATALGKVKVDTSRALKLPDESASQEIEANALQRRNKVVGFDKDGKLALLDGFTWRGDWTPNTDYFINDVVRDPDTKNLYVSRSRMTSGAAFNAANWSLGVNVVDIENAKAATEAARDTTLSARDTTLTARDTTLTARDTTKDYRDQTLTARDTTQGYRNTAEEHKNSAANTWNLIRGAYYGALASDPTLDPLGNAPNAGDRYYNTTVGAEKVFNGRVWRTNDLDTYAVGTSSGEQLIPAAIDRRGIVFDSVTDMKAFAGLQVGAKVRTLGYYSPGDGGGNDYEIVAAGTGTDDGGSYINLSGSSLQAKGLFGATVNVRQFGAVGDGVTDDTTAIQAASDLSDLSSLIFPPGGYVFGTVTVSNKMKISCAGGVLKHGTFNVLSGSDVEFYHVRYDGEWSPNDGNIINATSSDICVNNCDFRRVSNARILSFEKCNVKFIDNTIDGSTHGIENVTIPGVSSPATSKNDNVYICGCSFKNISASPINFRGVVGDPGTPEWVSGWDRSLSFFGSVIINGNTFEDNNGYACVFRSWNCSFTSNTIRNSKPPTFQGGNITFSSNFLYDMRTIGVDFGNVSTGSLSNNIIDTTDYAGIEINACERVVVANNTIRNPSNLTTSGLGSSAIWVHGENAVTVPARVSANISIIGNMLAKGTGGNIYGIAVEDPGSTVAVLLNQVQNSSSSEEIVSESQKLVAFMNMNNYLYDNALIPSTGTITQVTYPAS